MMARSSGVVIDSSVTIAWCFADEGSTQAMHLLDELQYVRATVPTIWPLEVANVLWVAEKRKRIARAESEKFREFLRALPFSIDETTSSRSLGSILDLAREQNITTYDAAYLELAMRENLHLASLDKALQNAAKHVGVNLV